MNAVTPFRFEDHDVRCFMRGDDPWLAAVDVCDALDLKNARQVTSKLDASEKGVQISDTLGGRQEIMVLSEAGVYTIMLRAKAAMQPGTKPYRFRKWVTNEVLPALRKTGQYNSLPAAANSDGNATNIWLGNPEAIERARVGIQMVREARVINGRTGAAKMWKHLGFPDVENDSDLRKRSDGPPVNMLTIYPESFQAPTSICEWFRARLLMQPDQRVKVCDLYADYAAWCGPNNWPVSTMQLFARSLTTAGVEKIHSNGTWAEGVMLAA